MTLYDYFNAFSRYIEEDSPTDKAIVLYWVLLDTFNRRGWPRWAGVDNQRLMLMCRTTDRKVMARARDILCKAGFLEYKPGKKGRATEYGLRIPKKYGGENVGEFPPENAPENGKGGEFPPESVPENAPESAPENAPPNKTKTKTMTESLSSSDDAPNPQTGKVPASVSADSDLSRVMTAYLDYLPGVPSEASKAKMAEYCHSLGAEVCLRAIDVAREAEPISKNKLAYLFGILRNREEAGIRTLADWDRHEAERRQRRNGFSETPATSAQNAGIPEQSADERWGIHSAF